MLSTTFDKYCYVTVRHLPPFFKHRNELIYSRIERTEDTGSIQHPAIREAMKYLNMHDLHIAYDADLPARTGLGTSSSFAVGLLSAFYALKGKYVDKKKLADDAIKLERELCGECGGIQDQIAASFGGFNRIDFNESGYTVRPVIISDQRKSALNKNLMLFYTGIARFSAAIQEETQRKLGDRTQALREMCGLVDEAQRVLMDKSADLYEFGRMLDEAWKLKRGIASGISTDTIDQIYETAKRAGAIGGKLLGAGGGGFLLFYVQEERQSAVRKALEDLLYIPFRFEHEGTHILYYQAEDYQIRR